jgi:hypothetical protein
MPLFNAALHSFADARPLAQRSAGKSALEQRSKAVKKHTYCHILL